MELANPKIIYDSVSGLCYSGTFQKAQAFVLTSMSCSWNTSRRVQHNCEVCVQISKYDSGERERVLFMAKSIKQVHIELVAGEGHWKSRFEVLPLSLCNVGCTK